MLETFLQRNGKRGVEEALLDLVIVVAMQREIAQIIFREELIEQVRGDDHAREEPKCALQESGA